MYECNIKNKKLYDNAFQPGQRATTVLGCNYKPDLVVISNLVVILFHLIQ